jgi:hypothetical protein
VSERITKISRTPAVQNEKLPYRIELRDAHARVLARAVNATLARAIFKAARKEHPERRIILRRDERIVADSSGMEHDRDE